MKKPLISLIIPTRERCDTLLFSLQTALNQESHNYEIVISDNFSQDDTKKVVESFNDSRIKYFNSGKRLSMCDNWDFACEKAEGEFIIIIGDDDGVVPGGIDYLETLIQEHPADVYFWDKHIFTWPNKGKKAEINYIAGTEKPSSIDLKQQARESILWGANDITDFPMIYHSAVSRKILGNILESTGRIFHSVNPDIFSAFSLPVFSNNSMNVGRCITAHGRSPKSNSGGGKEARELFLKEFGNYQWHPSLNSDWPTQIFLVVDSPLRAMEMFPEFYGDMNFNFSAMWAVYQKKSGKSIMEILRSREKIRQYHPFHVSIFIYYLFAHYVSTVKRKFLSKKSRIARRKISQGVLPNNILEFVNLVAEI